MNWFYLLLILWSCGLGVGFFGIYSKIIGGVVGMVWLGFEEEKCSWGDLYECVDW